MYMFLGSFDNFMNILWFTPRLITIVLFGFLDQLLDTENRLIVKFCKCYFIQYLISDRFHITKKIIVYSKLVYLLVLHHLLYKVRLSLIFCSSLIGLALCFCQITISLFYFHNNFMY